MTRRMGRSDLINWLMSYSIRYRMTISPLSPCWLEMDRERIASDRLEYSRYGGGNLSYLGRTFRWWGSAYLP